MSMHLLTGILLGLDQHLKVWSGWRIRWTTQMWGGLKRIKGLQLFIGLWLSGQSKSGQGQFSFSDVTYFGNHRSHHSCMGQIHLRRKEKRNKASPLRNNKKRHRKDNKDKKILAQTLAASYIYGQEKHNTKVFLLTQNKATNIKSCNIKKGQNNYMKIPSSSQSSLLWFRFLLASASEGSHSWPRPPWYQWDEDGIDEYHRSSRSIRSIEAYRNENEDKYNLLWEEKTLVSVSGIRGNTVRVPDDGQDGDGRCDGNMLVGIGRDNENNWLCW